MKVTKEGREKATHRHASPQIPIRTITIAIVVALVLYVAMATQADWNSFSHAVSSIPKVCWIEVVGLSLLSYLARFMRWHFFLKSLGHPIPFKRNLEIYLSGFAMTLSPGKVGEAIRSVYLRPYGVSYAQSIATFIAERLLDLVAVGCMACLGVFTFSKHRVWMFFGLLFCLMLLFLFRSRLLSLVADRFAHRSLGKQASNGIHTVKYLLSGPRLAAALPLSFFAWLAQSLTLYLIVTALNNDLSVISVTAIYCLSILAGAASFIPGGLGATEAALVFLLTSAGVAKTDAITSSLLGRGLTLWMAIAIGIVAMSKIAATVRHDKAVKVNSR